MRPRDMARRALPLLIAAGVLVPAVEAAEPGTNAPPPISLTVREAVTRALARSTDVGLARVAVEEKELALREARVREVEGEPRHVVSQALHELEVARNAFLATVHGVAVQVEESYYEVLRQQQMFTVRSRLLQQASRQLELAEARFEAGMISRQELEEAEEAAQRAREGVDQARRDLFIAEATLGVLVGLDPGSFTLAESVAFEPIDPDLGAGVDWALANRREIRDAEAAVRLAQELVQAFDNPYTPPVELRRAMLALRRAELQLQQTREKVAAEVRSQWVRLAAASQKVEATERARKLAASRLAIAQARYEAGQIGFLDLLEAQADEASAQLEAAGAVWEYNLEKARWLRTIARAPLPQLPAELETWMAAWQGDRGPG